jgi:hypothetical protein
MDYPVSISRGGEGCLPTLFAPKGRLTKATLHIDTANQTLRVSGESPLIKSMQSSFKFSEISEIEGRGPLIMVIRPQSGKSIQLKNVDDLEEILQTLEGHIKNVTPDLVRKRIKKFAERTGKSV